MEIEITETPVRFRLLGQSSVVSNNCYGEVGMTLMDEVWKVVKGARTATTGINHWVYLSDGRMFVGVELASNAQAPQQLESLEFELTRYARHVHIGPYQALPQKWHELKAELAARGEEIGSPSLEIYGHHCADPSKLETTILIGLRSKRC